MIFLELQTIRELVMEEEIKVKMAYIRWHLLTKASLFYRAASRRLNKTFSALGRPFKGQIRQLTWSMILIYVLKSTEVKFYTEHLCHRKWSHWKGFFKCCCVLDTLLFQGCARVLRSVETSPLAQTVNINFSWIFISFEQMHTCCMLLTARQSLFDLIQKIDIENNE